MIDDRRAAELAIEVLPDHLATLPARCIHDGRAGVAGEDLGEGGSARRIVLITDGEDTCTPPDPCEVARDLAALRAAVAPGEEPPPRAQERLTVTES